MLTLVIGIYVVVAAIILRAAAEEKLDIGIAMLLAATWPVILIAVLFLKESEIKEGRSNVVEFKRIRGIDEKNSKYTLDADIN